MCPYVSVDLTCCRIHQSAAFHTVPKSWQFPHTKHESIECSHTVWSVSTCVAVKRHTQNSVYINTLVNWLGILTNTLLLDILRELTSKLSPNFQYTIIIFCCCQLYRLLWKLNISTRALWNTFGFIWISYLTHNNKRAVTPYAKCQKISLCIFHVRGMILQGIGSFFFIVDWDPEEWNNGK